MLERNKCYVRSIIITLFGVMLTFYTSNIFFFSLFLSSTLRFFFVESIKLTAIMIALFSVATQNK